MKGFKDISVTHMKIKNDFQTLDARRQGNHSVKHGSAVKPIEGLVETESIKSQRNRSASKQRSGISSKVMETWVRDTLMEAEQHNSIPGTIIEQDKQNPMVRFGIDYDSLIKQGIKPDDITRIYRSLFVYSVGFYEMLKKMIDPTTGSYSVCTSIWKAFAICLEFCCRSDYKMLVAQITSEFQKELADFEMKSNKKHEL